jgi:translation initiation factor 1
MPSRFDQNPTVYSTETGRGCPKCGRPLAQCVCKKTPSRPSGDGVVRIRVESKGRKGKTVTTLTGVAGNDDTLNALASELKRQCGTGGTVKDGIIEIQGDHAAALLEILKKKGLTVKRAGG